jgi:hypothetical protein
VRRRLRLLGIALALIVGLGYASGHAVGVVAIAVVVALPVALFLRFAPRSRGELVAWTVSLVVSAVMTTPSFVLQDAHHKRLFYVAVAIAEWLLLAAILRLVIFLADYFRKRGTGVPVDG